MLTLCICLLRTDSTYLSGSTGSAAVGEGGAGPGGVGGVPRAPVAPLAADAARARVRIERSPRLLFSLPAGCAVPMGACVCRVRPKRLRGAARACGIGSGVVPGRAGAVERVRNVFCGRPLSPARARWLRCLLRHNGNVSYYTVSRVHRVLRRPSWVVWDAQTGQLSRGIRSFTRKLAPRLPNPPLTRKKLRYTVEFVCHFQLLVTTSGGLQTHTI